MSDFNTYTHWQAQFNEERIRLLVALGAITAGGSGLAGIPYAATVQSSHL